MTPSVLDLLFQETTGPAAWIAASATVCVTGLGLYDLRINGVKAGHEFLTPGWTEYDKRIEFQTFDVAGLLRPGDNRIEITLGNGWWLLHHKGFQEDGLDCRLKARLLLSLEETDGTVRHIGTDNSWTARPSAWLMNHLYYGETVDFAFADSTEFPVELLPEQAPLVPHAAEPIVITERLAPLSITRPPNGSHLIDFGQNLAGWVELQAPPVPVKRLTLRHAETLRPDGSLNTDSIRTANATETYLNVPARGETLAPRFTYHGFRYCELHGWPGDLPPEQLRACFVHTDLSPAGRFTCSDPTLTRIWEATRQSFRGNFHAVPSDCPQRDERLGWMADAGNIPDIAALFFDILTQRDYPSHGRILDLGATTTTEAWNAYLGDDFASHNHFNLGAVSAWFLRDLAGIRPGRAPDIIAPVFPAKIDHIDAEWISPQGPIRVHWQREADRIQLHIDTPVPGTLHLPDGRSLPLHAGPQLLKIHP